MKIGVQLPEVERPITWPELRDVAIAAEDGGLDSIWTGDHLLYRRHPQAQGPWEAWTTMAALAEATSRVEIGPLVAATSFHSPAMIAKFASTVDQISGGRLVLGLGAGWNEVEYKAFGFPFDNRVSRFVEAFTIIHTLVREGAIDFEGRYHVLRDMELIPPARPDMKILVGSNGPRMLRATMAHADMWNSWFDGYGNRAAGLEELTGRVDAACVDVGRDPAEVERTVAVYVQFPGGQGRDYGTGDGPKVTPITGSREEIAAELSAFATVGIGHIQAVLDPIDTDSVEELAEIARLM